MILALKSLVSNYLKNISDREVLFTLTENIKKHHLKRITFIFLLEGNVLYEKIGMEKACMKFNIIM